MSALIPDHDLAGIFPLLSGQPFQDLVEDIRSHGLHEPIVLLDDKILDGRNRYRACLAAGLEPDFQVFEGDDPVSYVISRNLHRRHLNESQRAAVAARLANLGAGHNQYTSGPANLQDHPTNASRAASVGVPRAAEMLNVSDRSVRTARTVQREAVPEIVAKVDAGKLSVSAASTVAKLPAAQQRDIASKNDEELRAKLRELGEAAQKHKARMATLPSKEEALALSEQNGGGFRANDGKLHIFVAPEDEKKLDIWFAIKPHVEALAETEISPAQFLDSVDAFWISRFPDVMDRAIKFLTEARQLMEVRHGASQVAAE